MLFGIEDRGRSGLHSRAVVFLPVAGSTLLSVLNVISTSLLDVRTLHGASPGVGIARIHAQTFFTAVFAFDLPAQSAVGFVAGFADFAAVEYRAIRWPLSMISSSIVCLSIESG